MTKQPLLRLDGLSPFFERVRTAKQRALLLDFDGTIAPFTANRSLAAPYPGVRSQLRALALASPETRVAIVSGRGLDDLRRRAALDPPLELWGSHGLERLTRDGRRIAMPPTVELRRVLEEIASAFEAARLVHVLERKPYGVAIHRRGSPADAFDAARRELERFAEPAARAGLQKLAFDGGVELRAAGSDKGLAVKAMFAELGSEAAVAYLGDDRTDEDAFAALGESGLAVLVGEVPHETRARAWIRPPSELLTFLSDWAAASRGGAS